MRDIKEFTAWKFFDSLDNKKDKDLINIITNAAIGKKDQSMELWMERFDD